MEAQLERAVRLKNWILETGGGVQLSVVTRSRVYLQEWVAVVRQEERTLKVRKLKEL